MTKTNLPQWDWNDVVNRLSAQRCREFNFPLHQPPPLTNWRPIWQFCLRVVRSIIEFVSYATATRLGELGRALEKLGLKI